MYKQRNYYYIITLNLKVFNSIGNNYQFNFLIPSTCRNIATKQVQFKARSNSPKTKMFHLLPMSAIFKVRQPSYYVARFHLQIRHYICRSAYTLFCKCTNTHSKNYLHIYIKSMRYKAFTVYAVITVFLESSN